MPDRFDRISYVETANLHRKRNAGRDLPLYQGAIPEHVQSMCASKPPLLLAEIMEAPETGIDLDQLAGLWAERAAPTVFFLIDKEKESTLMCIKDW
jgi:hypothetical protein